MTNTGRDFSGIRSQNKKMIANLIFSGIVLAACIFLLPRLFVLFMPFVIGWIISCIANPPVVFLEKKLKIRRKAGTFVVIVLVIGMVIAAGYAVISLLVRQIYGFIKDIPLMWEILAADFDELGSQLEHITGSFAPNLSKTMSELGDAILDAIKKLPSNLNMGTFEGMGSMVGSTASVIIGIIMCMLSSYIFIAERDEVISQFARLIPKEVAHKFDVFYESLKRAIGGYIKAQLRIEVWMYFLLLIGLMILGIRYAFLIALLMAVIDVLPFFGTGIVLVPWAIVSFVGGNYFRAVGFIVIWGLGQLIRQLIQPRIMGDSIGMPPMPTLLLLYVGYKIAGVGGMLIAVPLGILIVNMNEAGFFDTPKNSFRILLHNFNTYRQLNDEDLHTLESDENSLSDSDEAEK